MESKEKCEQIIQMFNGKALHGGKDPLLVKFADGGSKKKSLYKSTIWRETGDVSNSVIRVSFSHLHSSISEEIRLGSYQLEFAMRRRLEHHLSE